MSIRKVSFGTTKVQKLRRVALAESLLATLNIKEGDTVTVDLDVAEATIVIRKADTDVGARSKRSSRAEHGR